MKLRGTKRLNDFAAKNADASPALKTWAVMVKAANWKKNTDIRGFFGSASFLGERRVVFNIKGNKYRLVADINYEIGTVLVIKIGTHAEYNKWNL